MLWPKGIGLDCCFTAVVFLKRIAKTSVIIDPFCGYGTVLAMSNALGTMIPNGYICILRITCHLIACQKLHILHKYITFLICLFYLFDYISTR